MPTWADLFRDRFEPKAERFAVILYTTLGGFLAEAVSDLLRGMVLAIGLVVSGLYTRFGGVSSALGT